MEENIKYHKIKISELSENIKHRKEQQYQVRNNKEYEALTKEIENLELDIQLAEKRIRENQEK